MSPIILTTKSDMFNLTSKTDSSIDMEEWQPGTMATLEDSMVASMRKKLSRNRKVKVRFFLNAKVNDLH